MIERNYRTRISVVAYCKHGLTVGIHKQTPFHILFLDRGSTVVEMRTVHHLRLRITEADSRKVV